MSASLTGIPIIFRPGGGRRIERRAGVPGCSPKSASAAGCATAVYARCTRLWIAGACFCYAGTGADRAQETLNVMMAELVRLGQGIEDAELDRLKARIKSRTDYAAGIELRAGTSIGTRWYHLGRIRPLDEVGRLDRRFKQPHHQRLSGEHPPAIYRGSPSVPSAGHAQRQKLSCPPGARKIIGLWHTSCYFRFFAIGILAKTGVLRLVCLAMFELLESVSVRCLKGFQTPLRGHAWR